MNVREEADAGPAGDVPPPAVPGTQLPRSSFLWLALLVLSFVASALITRPDKPALSADDFARISQAESSLRSAFALDPAEGGTPRQRDKLLSDAAAAYRKVNRRSPGVNAPRKILILEHALGKPLDEAVLTRDLPDGLKARMTAPAEIAVEQRLWRSLYGDRPSRLMPTEKITAEARIRAMNLGFLEGVAVADLYRASGDAAEAELRAAYVSVARRHLALQGLLVLGGLFVFAAGILLWLWFLTNLRAKRWRHIGFGPEETPENTRPTALGFGALVDVFIAYLTLSRLFNVAAGFVLPALLPAEPSRQAVVLVTALGYVFPTVFSVFYLNATLRRYGCSWKALGWTDGGRPLVQIGYGVLAWFASVPLTIALGLLSQLVFRDGADLAPNPVLPLTAVGTDPLSRAILFLLAVVAAPLLEELFFRGALLTGLRSRYSWLYAVLLSALVFAVVHPRHDWIPIFGLGVVLGTARTVRGGLLAPIVAHMLQNAFAFLMLSTLFSP